MRSRCLTEVCSANPMNTSTCVQLTVQNEILGVRLVLRSAACTKSATTDPTAIEAVTNRTYRRAYSEVEAKTIVTEQCISNFNVVTVCYRSDILGFPAQH